MTGERLVTSKYGQHTNWAKGLNKFGGPEHDPLKDPTVGGAIDGHQYLTAATGDTLWAFILN